MAFLIDIRIIAAALLLSAGGCTTSNLSDIAPTAAVTPTPRPADAPAAEKVSEPESPPDAAGPVDTGTFPNLNTKPDAATGQFAKTEADAKIAELKAAKAGQGSKSGASAAEVARLKKLAKSHAEKTLDEIEN